MRIKMTESKFSIGDPVWSKMKGYCAWPSRIASPHESSLKNDKSSKTPKVHYLVYFFGSNNFAWMPEDTIKPYDENKDKNRQGSKSVQFKQGLKAIEEYIEKGGKASLDDVVTSTAAIKNSTNNDNLTSPSGLEDSVSNDASNVDGDLPSIDDEIAAINNKKPAPSLALAKKSKKAVESHNDSASLTSPAPSSLQKDYSRTPFKSRKSARSDEIATETSSPTKRVKTNDDESLSSPTISKAITTSKPPTSKYGAKNVLLRVGQYSDSLTTDVPKVNLSSISAKSRTIRPSNLKFGFIGVGFMGQRILKNLLNSGHSVTIWNRTSSKCNGFIEAGALPAKTPADVVQTVDIVFSCLSDPKASKEIVFGPFGILSEMNSGKGYVELSSIDPETSNDISEAIIGRGGRYLEAPLIANGKQVTENGEATIVAAGDKSLYEDCSSCFQAIGKQAFFLGHQPGSASKMNLIFSMLIGNIVGAIAESASLLGRNQQTELQMKDFRDILKLSVINCPLVDIVCEKLAQTTAACPEIPLNHLQKDLRLALEMSDEYNQMLPITATTNEQFKNAKKYGYGEQDASAIYLRSRYGLS